MGDFIAKDIHWFMGSLKKTGFDGELVVAINEETKQEVIEVIKSYNPVIYKIVPECEGIDHPGTKVCGIPGQKISKVSINMLRYILYQWWTAKYTSNAVILISDFRDVLFQSNPFVYMADQWAPPRADLTVFLESLPQKVYTR
jgi:hypothetical protein